MRDKIMWAGQNSRWGGLERATKAWAEMGVSNMMIRQTPESVLMNDNGEPEIQTYEKLAGLQKEFGVQYHFHPFDLEYKGKFLTLSTPEERKITNEFLAGLDNLIEKYSFYPLINLHLPFFVRPKQNILIDEDEALDRAHDFYQELNLKSKVCLETMHDPFKNGDSGTAILGYDPSQFISVIGKKDIGLCIDTGHNNLSLTPTRRYLALSYPIFCVHLHGNDMHMDQHLLPTSQNVKDYKSTIEAIAKCAGPVVLEIGNSSQKEEIMRQIEAWDNAVHESQLQSQKIY